LKYIEFWYILEGFRYQWEKFRQLLKDFWYLLEEFRHLLEHYDTYWKFSESYWKYSNDYCKNSFAYRNIPRFLMGKGIVLPSSLFWHDKPLIAYESVRMRWINISKWDNSYYFLWSKNLAIWLVSYPGVNSTPPQLNHLHPG
jgi:hypothetical protein